MDDDAKVVIAIMFAFVLAVVLIFAIESTRPQCQYVYSEALGGYVEVCQFQDGSR